MGFLSGCSTCHYTCSSSSTSTPPPVPPPLPRRRSLLEFPNEIIINILSTIPSKELLQLALVNRLFFTFIFKILHARLDVENPLPGELLILEAYAPAKNLIAPTLRCDYQGLVVRDGPPPDPASPKLEDLTRLYYTFKPSHDSRDVYRQHVVALFNGLPPPSVENRVIHTAEFEYKGCMFTQLCANFKIFKDSFPPQFRDVIAKKVVRIFRRWCDELAVDYLSEDSTMTDDQRILWLDSKDYGIRFRLVQVLDEESGDLTPVPEPGGYREARYTLELEELLVRSSQFLLGLEECHSPARRHRESYVIFTRRYS